MNFGINNCKVLVEGVHTVLVLVTKKFATLCIEQNKAILKPYYSCLKYILTLTIITKIVPAPQDKT